MATNAKYKIFNGTSWEEIIFPVGDHTHSEYAPKASPTFTGTIDASSGTLKIRTINAPTLSGGTTYGPGTNGYVLKSNGSTIFWASDSNSTTYLSYSASSVANTSTLVNYLIGKQSVTTNGNNYYNSNIYFKGNKIYSNNSEVVNLSDAQIITGLKTFSSGLKIPADDSYQSIDFYSTDVGGTVHLQCEVNDDEEDKFITIPIPSAEDDTLALRSDLPTNATSIIYGLVKLYTNTVQTVAPQTEYTSAAGRTYGIQKNSSGQLVVNVPWTNTTPPTYYRHFITVQSNYWGTSTTAAGSTVAFVSFEVITTDSVAVRTIALLLAFLGSRNITSSSSSIMGLTGTYAACVYRYSTTVLAVGYKSARSATSYTYNYLLSSQTTTVTDNVVTIN